MIHIKNPECEKQKLTRWRFYKKIIPIFLVIISLIAFSSCSAKTKSFIFDKDEYTIYVDNKQNISYTIVPNDVDTSKIVWQSSNTSVATVENGTITAMSIGNCVISATIDNIVCNCDISVIEETVFEELIPDDTLKLCFFELIDDGNCLKLDTNPYNTGSLMGSVGERDYSIIKTLHDYLNLPESLTEKMAQTRAIDGRITETIGDLSISWIYSPESGLEATYEKIDLN